MLREYLVSESMAALGISSSRSLGVFATGEQMNRSGDNSGAILARIASSHIRVGTFEYIAMLDDVKLLEEFTTYTIHRHYPDINRDANLYQNFITKV